MSTKVTLSYSNPNSMEICPLKSKKRIEHLFQSGLRLKAYPVHLLAMSTDEGGCQVGVSAPKRMFKRAVDRNRIKRQLRSATQQQFKGIIMDGHHCFMFIHVGPEPLVYNVLRKKIAVLINRYLHELEHSGR